MTKVLKPPLRARKFFWSPWREKWKYFDPPQKKSTILNYFKQVFKKCWTPSPVDHPLAAGLKMTNPLLSIFFNTSRNAIWHLFDALLPDVIYLSTLSMIVLLSFIANLSISMVDFRPLSIRTPHLLNFQKRLTPTQNPPFIRYVKVTKYLQ